MNKANQQLRKMLKRQIVIKSSFNSSFAFCIVHWNAPDFLMLTVKQIERIHPNSKIYILDNGSDIKNLGLIIKGLSEFKNITLFRLTDCPRWAKLLRIEAAWHNHAAGLQFLVNYSAAQKDDLAVFLDQDCIICERLDSLFSQFNENVVLIGARDYVTVPCDYGPLKKGRLRDSYNLVHPSFMLLQPMRINNLYGDSSSLFDVRSKLQKYYSKKATSEPYHGLSFKAAGRIRFLEPQMHPSIPLLTSYSYNGIVYAWHAWYSSRTANTRHASVDGYPVTWLTDVRRIEYEFMEKL